jgi:hypothetical protein
MALPLKHLAQVVFAPARQVSLPAARIRHHPFDENERIEFLLGARRRAVWRRWRVW